MMLCILDMLTSMIRIYFVEGRFEVSNVEGSTFLVWLSFSIFHYETFTHWEHSNSDQVNLATWGNHQLKSLSSFTMPSWVWNTLPDFVWSILFLCLSTRNLTFLFKRFTVISVKWLCTVLLFVCAQLRLFNRQLVRSNQKSVSSSCQWLCSTW